MEVKKNLTFEEKEKIRIMQEIIECDNNIVKCYIAHDAELYDHYTEKKLNLEFELEQLIPEEYE